MRTLPRLFLLGCLLPGLAAAVGPDAQAGPESAVKYSDNGYPILDPAHANTARLNDERLIVTLLDCLTVLDANTGKAGPGAAERWDTSADRRTWTFHLRKTGVWSDGSMVTAHDFVRSWKRMIDPFTKSPWTSAFRVIKGCALISDNSARTESFGDLRKGLRELKKANPNGIKGSDLILLVEETGVKPYLSGVRSRSVSSMISWKDEDVFGPELVDASIDALRKEKRRLKDLWVDEFDAFGKPGTGAHAKDDQTLVVTTDGDVPFLPEMLARSAFAPLHKSQEAKRDQFFKVGSYISNGPYVLKGRGAEPPERQPNKPVLSVVHLARNPKYDGPSPGKLDEILCFTDQDLGVDFREDIRQYKAGILKWVNTTWPDGVPAKPKKLRKEIESLPGYEVRPMPVVLYLRFRCDREPFKHLEARKAIALAIDRKRLARSYWPAAVPANRIVPPGIEGRVDGVIAPKADANAAKAAAKTAGFDEETWVELSYGEGTGQDAAASVLIRGWQKTIGISEPSQRLETPLDAMKSLRSGNFYIMISAVRGAANDPYAYLGPLHSGDVESGHGWHDKATNALIEAARDPDSALKNPDRWLKRVEQPGIELALEAAKRSQGGRARLRREALAAAEQRLMDAYVIVPLLYIREAVLMNGCRGLGSDQARNNPGFVGSLRNLQR